MLSRRNLLRSSALGLAGAALAACTTTTSGGVTTITLDVTKVKNYGQAGLNAAAAVIAFSAQFPAISAYVPAIQAAEIALSGALTAFSTAAGATLTISYNNTDWKTRVDSVLSDLSTVAGAIESAISGAGSALSASVLSDAKTALSALNTIISVFKGLLGVSAVRSSAGMTEAQALAALGV
ncbi:hypothetical protein [Acetobacter sicerae]|uniref:hypothetical protein n=1 Tax=Acetobacter sicerae TaxID=85325 RepID=UPI00156AE9D4|nr:hypothetical protein [Acetobacter sicerae]NHN93874.1 hypothetical protein [Acetobacter sicerae]